MWDGKGRNGRRGKETEEEERERKGKEGKGREGRGRSENNEGGRRGEGGKRIRGGMRGGMRVILKDMIKRKLFLCSVLLNNDVRLLYLYLQYLFRFLYLKIFFH